MPTFCLKMWVCVIRIRLFLKKAHINHIIHFTANILLYERMYENNLKESIIAVLSSKE
jgi:hypothetical protein